MTEATAIIEAAVKENRSLTADENRTVERLTAEVRGKNKLVERMENLRNLDVESLEWRNG